MPQATDETTETETSETADPAFLEAGRRLFERPWSFERGVVGLDGLPEPARAEIAFAGRSNVGKSSLINAVVRQKGLARTSNTPGRTQELNFFGVDGVPMAIVDMPGYGYARAPKAKVDTWTRLIRDYLRGRQVLMRVMLLIDARHGIKTTDEGIMKLLDEVAVTYQIVLTKVDKIKPTGLAKLTEITLAKLTHHPAAFPEVVATSSEAGTGIAELRAAIVAASRIDPKTI